MANRIFPDPTEAGHYQWQGPGGAPVSLRFNELLHSVRVQAGDERRVYLLETTHFPTSKVALFSEYGLRIGSCTFEDTLRPQGSLRWDDQKFRFHSDEHTLYLQGPVHNSAYRWELPEEMNREACAGILLMLARQNLLQVAASPEARNPPRTDSDPGSSPRF
ncbi:hypothetical protein [Flaviaesturariibacter terrae]